VLSKQSTERANRQHHERLSVAYIVKSPWFHDLPRCNGWSARTGPGGSVKPRRSAARDTLTRLASLIRAGVW